MAVRGSEMPVAQPLNKLVAITRTASRRLQHLALDMIGLLGGLETFGEAARAFAGPPECQQEHEDGQRDGALAEGSPHPRAGDYPAQQRGDQPGHLGVNASLGDHRVAPGVADEDR